MMVSAGAPRSSDLATFPNAFDKGAVLRTMRRRRRRAGSGWPLGIGDGQLRLSVRIEAVPDLWSDIDQALG